MERWAETNPHHGLDADIELQGVERLGQVIVGAGHEAVEQAGLVRMAGDDDDGNADRQQDLPYLPDRFKTAHAGHLDIHQDEFRWRFLKSGNRLFSAADVGHRVAVAAEQAADVFTDRQTVVDKQYAQWIHGSGEGSWEIERVFLPAQYNQKNLPDNLLGQIFDQHEKPAIKLGIGNGFLADLDQGILVRGPGDGNRA